MQKKTKMFFVGILAVLVLSSLFSSFVNSLPAGPVINYVSNSTAAPFSANRSQDEKGTITVITLTSTQQDYKWKAYVGNVSGKLALDDGTAYTIYDWSLGTPTGEVYVTRSSSISWSSIGCANQTVINAEELSVSMSSSATDSINSTFASSIHRSFLVGTTSIVNSTCRSIATYVNDTAQVIDESSVFQEVLLADISGNMVYTTMIENNDQGFDNNNYDFQLLVAENESSTIPTTYFFYVELG
ncbi:MAG: hypothetical protein ACP5NV_03740 [Candidatus Woesearchaeota archaeon]